MLDLYESVLPMLALYESVLPMLASYESVLDDVMSNWYAIVFIYLKSIPSNSSMDMTIWDP